MNTQEDTSQSLAARPARKRLPLVIKAGAAAAVLLAIAGQASKVISTNLQDSHDGIVLPARIRPAHVQSIARTFPSMVSSVAVAPGQSVQAGQELAILASDEIATALSRAKEHVERCRQKIGASIGLTDKVVSEQTGAAGRAIESARSRLQQYSLDPFQQAYLRAQEQANRVDQLVQQGLATNEELSRAQHDIADARHALDEAIEHRSRLQQELDSAESQDRVLRLQADQQKDNSSETAQTEYDEALFDLRQAEQRWNELRVVAGQSGTIISATVNPGDHLLAGSTLFQIADLSGLQVDVPVAGKIARQIQPGNQVKVRLPLDPPKQLEAKVSEVLLVPDGETQSYLIRVMVPNPDPRTVLVGLEGAVVFPYLQKENWLWAQLRY